MKCSRCGCPVFHEKEEDKLKCIQSDPVVHKLLDRIGKVRDIQKSGSETWIELTEIILEFDDRGDE